MRFCLVLEWLSRYCGVGGRSSEFVEYGVHWVVVLYVPADSNTVYTKNIQENVELKVRMHVTQVLLPWHILMMFVVFQMQST